MNKPLASLKLAFYSFTFHTCTSLNSFFSGFFCIEQDLGSKLVIGGHKILKYELAAMMMK